MQREFALSCGDRTELVVLPSATSLLEFLEAEKGKFENARSLVYHFGADSSRQASDLALGKKNIESTRTLAHWVANGRDRFMVFASANSVTAERQTTLITGHTQPSLRDAYSRSKYISEVFLRKTIKRDRLLIARLPALYDAEKSSAGLLSRVLKQADLTYSNLNFLFNSTCSYDRAATFFSGLASHCRGFTGSVINLGFHPAVRLDIALSEQTKKARSELSFKKAREFLPIARRGYVFDLKPAQALGFKPEDFSEIISLLE